MDRGTTILLAWFAGFLMRPYLEVLLKAAFRAHEKGKDQ